MNNLNLLERKIFRYIRSAIKEFQLVEPGDSILIGLSGGKDSLALVEFLGKIKQSFRGNLRLFALHIRVKSVDYQTDDSYLSEFCKNAGAEYLLREISFEPDSDEKRTPCFLCSWNRRKTLFEVAQELSCDKIALGHHQDDILHTALMNLTLNGTFSTMPALMKMRKMPLTIVRPLCSVPEILLKRWAQENHYQSLLKVCPHDNVGKRKEVVHVLETLEKYSVEARASIWNALKKDAKLVDK